MEYASALARLRDSAGKASTAQIAQALGKADTSASAWHKRLIDRQVIKPAGRGFVRFAIPYAADYLNQKLVAHDEAEDDEWET